MNKEVEDFLIKNKDIKYLEFSKNLNIGSKRKYLGVRIPILRKYAKLLSRTYSLDYLINNIMEKYYEEVMLKGFIIGNFNLDKKIIKKYISEHIVKLSDWSLCDTFVSSLKIVKKYPEFFWKLVLKELKSKNEYHVRFSLVMILNYYISDQYKNEIFKIIKEVNLDKYYVKMANAWLISYMFIYYFDDTYHFISNNLFDNWTRRKGITKAIESREITKEQKDRLRKLREEIK